MSAYCIKIPSSIVLSVVTGDTMITYFNGKHFEHAFDTFSQQLEGRKKGKYLDVTYIVSITDQASYDRIPKHMLQDVITNGDSLRTNLVFKGVTLADDIDKQVPQLPYAEIIEKFEGRSKKHLLVSHLAAHALQFGDDRLINIVGRFMPSEFNDSDHLRSIASLVNDGPHAEWIVLRVMDIGYTDTFHLESIAEARGWHQVLCRLSSHKPELELKSEPELKSSLIAALTKLSSNIQAINDMDLSDDATRELCRSLFVCAGSDWDPTGEARLLLSKQ